MSNADQIIDELEKTDRKLSVRNDGAWICCPWHSGGNEHTPSLRIRVDESDSYVDRFICFGCGKAGHFNLIAKELDLEPIDEDFKPVGNRKLSFRDKISKMQGGSTVERRYRPSLFEWPKDREWRNVPGHVLTRDGVMLSETRNELELPRLIFPVMVWGERVGEIYALLNDPERDESGKKTDMSYINSKGSWKEKSLFGFDRARAILKKHPDYPLWFVEGPRDRYWCEAAGCAVVGNLGSSFSDEKAELIMMTGAKRLLVASDADEAGDKLAERVHEKLHTRLPLSKINWKAGSDPCNASLEKLKKINERFRRK